MLVAAGGCGRSSLTRIAAHLTGHVVVSVDANRGYGAAEWREDLKRVLIQAGLKSVPTVLLLSHLQLQDAFLDELNGLLLHAEVQHPPRCTHWSSDWCTVSGPRSVPRLIKSIDVSS